MGSLRVVYVTRTYFFSSRGECTAEEGCRRPVFFKLNCVEERGCLESECLGGVRFFTPERLPGDTAAAGPWTTLSSKAPNHELQVGPIKNQIPVLFVQRFSKHKILCFLQAPQVILLCQLMRNNSSRRCATSHTML